MPTGPPTKSRARPCSPVTVWEQELLEMEWTAPHEKGNPGRRVLTSEGLLNVPPWETVQSPR